MPFEFWEPTPGKLPHIYHVNQVRLRNEAQATADKRDCYWFSERWFRYKEAAKKPKDRIGHVPDGVWFVCSDMPEALEIELSPKPTDRLLRILQGLETWDYSWVEYVAAPAARPHVRSAIEAIKRPGRPRQRMWDIGVTNLADVPNDLAAALDKLPPDQSPGIPYTPRWWDQRQAAMLD
jgi:hypothetical protein